MILPTGSEFLFGESFAAEQFIDRNAKEFAHFHQGICRGHIYVAVYMEQLKTAEARIPCSSWPTIETILNTAFESVLRGQASSQEALDNAAAQIDELLAQE